MSKFKKDNFFYSESIYFLEYIRSLDSKSDANHILGELQKLHKEKLFKKYKFKSFTLIHLDNDQCIFEDNSTIMLFTGMVKNINEIQKLIYESTDIAIDEIDAMSVAEIIFNLYLIFEKKFSNYINGLFHIILFNKVNEKLKIVNDRFGICFVYYYDNIKRYISSSSLDILMATGLKRKLSLEALDDYLSYRISQPPNTMYQGVYKLPQASFIEVSSELEIYSYLDLKSSLSFNNKKETIDLFKEHFKNSTLGSFNMPNPCFTLSGGVDSSIISKLASEHTSINTFNLSVGRNNYIDEHVSREISSNLSTNHSVVKLAATDLLDQEFFDMCINMIEEPTVNSFPNEIKLNKTINNSFSTTVYGSMAPAAYFEGYFWKQALNNKKYFFKPLYRILLSAIERINIFNGKMNFYKKILLRIIPILRSRAYSKSEKIEDANRLFKDHLKRQLLSPANLGSLQPKKTASNIFSSISADNDVNKAMYTEFFCQSIARTSLFNSMHQKMLHLFYYPYLDVSFADFNLSVSSDLKLEKKIAEHAFLNDDIEASFNRPRQGMSLAYEWLGDELHDWSKKILLNTPHPIDEYFNKRTIEFMLDSHSSKKYDFGVYLWSLIVLKKWVIIKEVKV